MKSSSKLIKKSSFLPGEVVDLQATVLENREMEIAATSETEISENEPESIDLESVQEEAALLYLEAQKKAAMIVKAAKEDADRIRENARTEGLKDGLSKGKKESEEVLKNQLQRISKTLDDLAVAKQELIDEAKEDILELLRLSIQKVCENLVDDRLIVKLLENTLPLLADCRELVLEVSPEDLEAIENYKEMILANCLNLKDLKIVSSEQVEKGGFFVKSCVGNIDAKLSTRINNMLSLMSLEEKVEASSNE